MWLACSVRLVYSKTRNFDSQSRIPKFNERNLKRDLGTNPLWELGRLDLIVCWYKMNMHSFKCHDKGEVTQGRCILLNPIQKLLRSCPSLGF